MGRSWLALAILFLCRAASAADLLGTWEVNTAFAAEYNGDVYECASATTLSHTWWISEDYISVFYADTLIFYTSGLGTIDIDAVTIEAAVNATVCFPALYPSNYGLPANRDITVRATVTGLNAWGEIDTVKVIIAYNDTTCPEATATATCSGADDTLSLTSVHTLKRVTRDATLACSALCRQYIGFADDMGEGTGYTQDACVADCAELRADGILMPASSSPTINDLQCRMAYIEEANVQWYSDDWSSDIWYDAWESAKIADNTKCTGVSNDTDTTLACSRYCTLVNQNCPEIPTAEGTLPAGAGWAGYAYQMGVTPFQACMALCSAGDEQIILWNRGTEALGAQSGDSVQCRLSMLYGSFDESNYANMCFVAGPMSQQCADPRAPWVFGPDAIAPQPLTWKVANRCDPSACCCFNGTFNAYAVQDADKVMFYTVLGSSPYCGGVTQFGGEAVVDMTSSASKPFGGAVLTIMASGVAVTADFNMTVAAHSAWRVMVQLPGQCPAYFCADTSDATSCPPAFDPKLNGINTPIPSSSSSSSSSSTGGSSSSSSTGPKVVVPSAAAHTEQSLLSAAFALGALMLARIYLV